MADFFTRIPANFETSKKGLKTMWGKQIKAFDKYFEKIEEEVAMSDLSESERILFRQQYDDDLYV